ncbi:metallophosphoesterase family protein [Palaeococcus ferrophilus]|uniref:metallophosphoesterase family protein n=1 Tax=Palaeococcus ferrophilus TaxID=83868 RepID=UPI00064EEEA3|nr:exonuclease SbcCD subunit D [Palaeococcus ferrophilus]
MKFAHIADVHLGLSRRIVNTREEDVARNFEEAIRKSLSEGVDFILIAGDLFDSSRPTPQTLRQAVRVLDLAREAGVPVFAIEGNHDRTHRKSSAYALLEDLGLIHLVGIRGESVENEYLRSEPRDDAYLVYGKVGDVTIKGMKYQNAPWFKRNDLKDIFRPDGKSILMLHQGIEETIKDVESQYSVGELALSQIPEGFAYYAFGHIHTNYFTNVGKAYLVYPGSVERTSAKEYSRKVLIDEFGKFQVFRGKPKGFVIAEWSDEEGIFVPSFRHLKTRRFYSIKARSMPLGLLRDVLRKVSSELKVGAEDVVKVTVEVEKTSNLDFIKSLFPTEFIDVEQRVVLREERIAGVEGVSLEDFFSKEEIAVLAALFEEEPDIEALVPAVLREFSVKEPEENEEKEKPEPQKGRKKEEPKEKSGEEGEGRKKKPDRKGSVTLDAFLKGGRV